MNARSSAQTRRLRHRLSDRATLLAAAEACFSAHGYHRTSIRDIAKAAGFSVGGVYQFFGSKDELYLAVIEEQWQQFFEAARPVDRENGVAARLRAFTRVSLDYFEARRSFFQIYLADRARFSGPFKDRVTTTVSRNHDLLRRRLAALMTDGVRQGVLRTADPQLLVCTYLGVLHNCLLDAIGGKLGRRGLPDADALVSLFLCGAARPGSRTWSSFARSS